MTLTRIANRNIWSIAWPMMLTSMSAPLLGLVDTAMLGHLESARYLAAVAIGANVIALLYWSFGFLRMGTTSLVSQSLGRQQLASQQNIVADRSSENQTRRRQPRTQEAVRPGSAPRDCLVRPASRSASRYH